LKSLDYIKRLAKKSRIIRSIHEKIRDNKMSTILDDKTFLELDKSTQEVDKQ